MIGSMKYGMPTSLSALANVFLVFIAIFITCLFIVAYKIEIKNFFKYGWREMRMKIYKSESGLIEVVKKLEDARKLIDVEMDEIAVDIFLRQRKGKISDEEIKYIESCIEELKKESESMTEKIDKIKAM